MFKILKNIGTGLAFSGKVVGSYFSGSKKLKKAKVNLKIAKVQAQQAALTGKADWEIIQAQNSKGYLKMFAFGVVLTPPPLMTFYAPLFYPEYVPTIQIMWESLGIVPKDFWTMYMMSLGSIFGHKIAKEVTGQIINYKKQKK